MAKESRSVLDAIKRDISNSGNSAFKNFFSIKDSGGKARVRFLEDMEDCTRIEFHDQYPGISHPCLEQYGKPCPNCDNPNVKTTTQYCWNVWNYETKQVELFMFKANKSSPIPGLTAIYDAFETITSADITITRIGTKTDTNYQCVSLPNPKPFTKEVKLYSEKKKLKLCLEAFNKFADDGGDDDDELAEVTPKRIKPKKEKVEKKYAYLGEDEEEDDDDDDMPFDIDDDEIEEESKKKSKSSAKKKKKVVEEYEEDDDEDTPFFYEGEDDEEEELPPPRKKPSVNKKKRAG